MASSSHWVAVDSLTVLQLRALLRKVKRPADGNRDELLYRLRLPILVGLPQLNIGMSSHKLRLTVIRHARQTMPGRLDPPIAADQTAPTYLEIDKYQLIICSPYLRTRQTVELLGQGKLRYGLEPRLSEFVDSPKTGRYHPGTLECQGIPEALETWEAFTARVEDFVASIRFLTPGIKVLIVTHGLVVKYLAQKLLPSQTLYPRGRDVPYMGGIEFDVVI